MAINVSLTDELSRFVAEQINSGKYASASDVVREALQLLESRSLEDAEKAARMQLLVDEGLASGKGEQSMTQLREAARKRAGL